MSRRSLTTEYAQARSRSVVVEYGFRLTTGAALDPGLRGSEGGAARKSGAPEETHDQATKGTRWMPRRQEAKKDVGSCEKRRGAANQALIRRCPNGETHGG